MIKIIAQFEHEVDGKIGRFIMDHDTSIASAKEMAFAFLKYLGNIEDQVKIAAKAKEEEEKVNQETVSDTPEEQIEEGTG